MKIVHTADWHIGKTVNEFSMLDDQKYYLEKLKELIVKINADVLIIAGDLYDRSVPPAQAVRLADEFFSDLTVNCKVKIICIAGNHDSPERLSFASRLCESGGLYICGKLDKNSVKKITLTDEYGNVNFYLLPYFDPISIRVQFKNDAIKTFNDAYRFLADMINCEMNKDERNVVTAHGNFSFIADGKQTEALFEQGEQSAGGADIVNAAVFEPFDYAALGHIHAPKRIGKDYIRYSGSLLKYSVDEAAQNKSVTIVNLGQKGDADISLETIEPLRDIRVLKGDFAGILSANDSNVDDYVFAELSDSQPVPDAILKLRAKYPNIMGLKYMFRADFSGSMITSREVESKSPEDLFGAFYKSMTGDELDKNQKAVVSEVFENVAKERDE